MRGPLLLLGGAGMLGRAFRQLLDARGIEYRAPDLDEVDFTNLDSVRRSVSTGTSVVLNCAAWTNVDLAEKEEAAATQINGEAVGCLAEACKRAGAVLVHYSTDYVFDGNASAPYAVDHPRAPLNAYGRSKAVGERLIEQASGEHLLLRTSWLYAPWAKNFVRTMLRLGAQKPSLRVVSDQVGRPTSAESLAELTLRLLERDARGTLHVTDSGQCSWFELAREALALAGSPCDVQPCTSAEYPLPAKRPSYSVLDIEPTIALIGPLPTWQDNLRSVVSRAEPD
jgi:dTDP-4-dehydrorhamnose reductase